MEQARALGRSQWAMTAKFRRYYTSDLTRAVQTAESVLESASRTEASLILEPRLREMAKGARQGFPKSMTYEEAIDSRRRQFFQDPLPRLETEDDCWDRMHSFLKEVMQQAHTECEAERSGDYPHCIFILIHSGILRIFLKRMIGEDLLYSHSRSRFDKTGLLYIPNTSVTILDVSTAAKDEKLSPYHDFNVNLVELTWADHLSGTVVDGSYAE